MRAKGLQVHPNATPTKARKGRLTPTAPRPDLGKVVYDERPTGAKMPILNSDGTPVRRGQVLREGDSRLKELHNMQQLPLKQR